MKKFKVVLVKKGNKSTSVNGSLWPTSTLDHMMFSANYPHDYNCPLSLDDARMVLKFFQKTMPECEFEIVENVL